MRYIKYFAKKYFEKKFSNYLALFVFCFGIYVSLTDFLLYSGVLNSLAIILSYIILVRVILRWRELLRAPKQEFDYVDIALTFFSITCGTVAFFLHSPAFDNNKANAEKDIFVAVSFNSMRADISDNDLEELMNNCLLQGTQDRVSTVAQAQEMKDSEAVSFLKRVTGTNYQAPADRCIETVNRIDKEYPSYFSMVRDDVKELNRKKSRFSW